MKMRLWVKKIPFSVQPEAVFAHLYQPKPYAFWLDGNLLAEGLSRYSYMGANPAFIVRVQQGQTERISPTQRQTIRTNPFAAVGQILEQYSLTDEATASHALPFVAGMVGYFGYEMKRYVENVATRLDHLVGAPEALWMFVDRVLILDQVEQTAYLTRLVQREERIAAIEEEMAEEMEQIRQVSLKGLEEPRLATIDVPTHEHRFQQLERVDSYLTKIKKIQQHIRKGDLYQACFTHPISTHLEVPPFALYRVLRRINPAPFSAYIQMNGLSIVSSSPERLLQCDLHRSLESRPMKGTRPRGSNAVEDQRLLQELQTSGKDRAENSMIVDLVRNDLGRVCEIGSIHVPTLFQVETYATVHQLVSTVRGQLRTDVQPIEAIQMAFPGGSMTGTPKIRAMNLLHELEPVARGVYAGGLGYLDLRGSFDLSMVIRTLLCQRGRIYFHVGGGITADSDPAQEYQESIDKAFALKKAILQARRET
jgi:para-aminobenzoate synthetase component I